MSSPCYLEAGGSDHGAGKNQLIEIMIFYHLEISKKPAVFNTTNQPESQTLYHKNGSLRDFYIKPLFLHAAATAAAYKWFCTFPSP